MNQDNDLTDRLAEGRAKAVIEAGPVVMRDPEDYEARATVMWAGSISHNDLMGTGRLFSAMHAHALEHELSALRHEISHGAGLAVMWPAYLRFIYRHALDRVVQYAVRIWNCEMNFEHPEITALKGIEATERFFASLGMPLRLSELGIGEEDIDGMADKCTAGGTKVLKSYIDIDREMVKEIYRLCL